MEDCTTWFFIPQNSVAPRSQMIQLMGTREETKQKVQRLYPDTKFFQYSERAYYNIASNM